MNEATKPVRMKFHHITAASACTQCSYSVESQSSTLSGLHLLLALTAAAPLSFILLRAPWSLPWYSSFGIVAAEVLVFFAAGFLISPFIGRSAPASCPHCGASVTFRGRYFSDSPRPRAADVAMLALFTIANIFAIAYVWPSRIFP